MVVQGGHFIGTLAGVFRFAGTMVSVCPRVPSLGSRRGCFRNKIRRNVIVRSGRFSAFSTPVLCTGSISKLMFHGGGVQVGARCGPFR